MRELMLFRHAKSAWDTKVQNDFDRPLAKRGERNARMMADWMGRESIVPDFILSSSALRARKTADILADRFDIDRSKVKAVDALYLADVPTQLKYLARVPVDFSRVMLVGHNPGLEELLLFLAASGAYRTQKGKLMTTASLAHLQLPDQWQQLSQCSGVLLQLFKPEDLLQKLAV